MRILSAKIKNAREITTDYYGYGLPWIIHAGGQQLRAAGSDEHADELDKISLAVELGLPSVSAAKVYLCGIRSRSSAVQISSRLRNLEESSLRQLRLFLTAEEARTRLKPLIDELAQRWLDILYFEQRARAPVAHSIRDFQLKVHTDIDALHVRELNGNFYLCSVDCAYVHSTRPTMEFPFQLIANNPRYVFTRNPTASHVWSLKTRDPQLAAVQQPPEITVT